MSDPLLSDPLLPLIAFLDHASGQDADEVPDPYGESQEGFERVLDMIEDAARGLIESLGRAQR